MALPKFTDSAGANAYIWAEGSNLPGDRYDLSVDMRMTNYSIEHQRHGIVFAREVLSTLADFTFVWKSISQAMVSAISAFYEMTSFRYYADSDVGTYKPVYMVGGFNPRTKRGGTYDLTITLKEI